MLTINLYLYDVNGLCHICFSSIRMTAAPKVRTNNLLFEYLLVYVGTLQKVKVIKKQTILVTLSFFQGISYSNELILGFITVQSERTNKNTVTSS